MSFGTKIIQILSIIGECNSGSFIYFLRRKVDVVEEQGLPTHVYVLSKDSEFFLDFAIIIKSGFIKRFYIFFFM